MNDAMRSGTLAAPEATLASRVAWHAVREPSRPAIRCGATRLNYGELMSRACAVAEQLLARGIGQDDIVPICAARSPEAIAALLGVWLAGAAYAPLDPAQPATRTAAIVGTLHSKVALTDVVGEKSLDGLGLELMSIDVTPNRVSAKFAPVALTAGRLAYCLYTSGSTGAPKGILQTHATLTNLYDWQSAHPDYAGAHERTLQFTSFGFDVSVQEIMFTLADGGELVMPEAGRERDMSALAELIIDAGVTTLYSPSTPLQVLVGLVLDRRRPVALRHLISAGEPLYVSTALCELMETTPGLRLHNQYGPTETHVVTAHTVAVKRPKLHPPIGIPIDGVLVRILDASLRSVPPGETGEICIGGIALARGYLGQPDLTAERFVPDPDGPSGTRLYRTGDRGAWGADGELHFHGRADFQVKVRGFRIEIEEVESAIRECDGVREAAVLAVVDGDGDEQRLAAFIAPNTLDTAVVSVALAARLPEYMVPSLWTALPALPINANGKVDRSALPIVTRRPRPALASAWQPPRTSEERRIAELWCDLLGLDSVGLNDGFFELGGTSLLAGRLTLRLRALGLDVSVTDVIGAGTIAALLSQRAGAPAVADQRRPGRYSRRSSPISTGCTPSDSGCATLPNDKAT